MVWNKREKISDSETDKLVHIKLKVYQKKQFPS